MRGGTRGALAAAAALVVAATGLASATAASAAAVAPPQVMLRDTGKIWRFDSAQVEVAVRCFGGAVVQELVVDIDQGDLHAENADDFGIVCDGVRRVVEVIAGTGGPEFAAGDAHVTARLTVLDPVTMDPLPQGVSSRTVYLRAPAAVQVANKPVRLRANGNAVVSASVKCQIPWVSQTFVIDVRQNGGRIGGSAFVEDTPCDGTFHEYTRTIVPNKPFTPGLVKVGAAVSVLDPFDFDPVGGASIVANRQAVPFGQ